MIMEIKMSYGCGYHDCSVDCCSNCCTVTPLFWVYMLGIAGVFTSLFFFFWQYPGTLTQFVGPKEEGYAFTDNGDGGFYVFRDNLLVGQGAMNDSDGADLADLRHARCRGTSLLWTMLVAGLLSVLFLLWWFVDCPNRFICCSLQQPYMEMQKQMYPAAMPVKPMAPGLAPTTVKAAPVMPAPMIPPQSPGPQSPGPKLA